MRIHTTMRKRLSKVVLHILGWLLLMVLPAYLFFGASVIDTLFLVQYSLEIILMLVIFYINYLWLAPRLFFRKRKVEYAITMIVIIGISGFLHINARQYLGKPGGNNPRPPELLAGDSKIEVHPDSFGIHQQLNHDGPRPKEAPPKPMKNFPTYNFVLMSVFISGMALGLRFSEKLEKNEKQRVEIGRLKLNAELAYLKNQISPHFFFNTLNNIYSLVEYDTKECQKAILELSKLMRYLLYESSNDAVSLQKEIAFLKNYFELMKLRFTKRVEIKAVFPERYTDTMVPPLLFLPFVENAFKHGITNREPSFIDVEMITTGASVFFRCYNSIGSFKDSNAEESGIGLDNVKKRLDLLFPEKYKLFLQAGDKVFKAELTIDLS